MRILLLLFIVSCRSPDGYSGYVEYTDDQRETSQLDSSNIVTGGVMLTWDAGARLQAHEAAWMAAKDAAETRLILSEAEPVIVNVEQPSEAGEPVVVNVDTKPLEQDDAVSERIETAITDVSLGPYGIPTFWFIALNGALLLLLIWGAKRLGIIHFVRSLWSAKKQPPSEQSNEPPSHPS